MKPVSFDYTTPATVDEAVTALQSGEDAKILAGGQSLVPLMSLRLARPELIVEINAVSGLDGVVIADRQVRIGALCRHRRLELDPELGIAVPLLAEAATFVGHPSIRNRGTLGGSIAHADPASELPAALLALNGAVVAAGPGGRRTVQAADLFQGFFVTALEPDELLVEVVVPQRVTGQGTAFVEFAPRHGDFAVAGMAAVVRRAMEGELEEVRLAGAGIGSTPVDLSATAGPLLGERRLTENLLREVAARVAAAVEPVADVHASSDDRRELAQILAVRALKRAWERSEGENR